MYGQGDLLSTSGRLEVRVIQVASVTRYSLKICLGTLFSSKGF